MSGVTQARPRPAGAAERRLLTRIHRIALARQLVWLGSWGALTTSLVLLRPLLGARAARRSSAR